MNERWTGNLFQKSEAADEKDFDFAIVVLRDGTHIVKEEDDRSDRTGRRYATVTDWFAVKIHRQMLRSCKARARFVHAYQFLKKNYTVN